MKIIRTKHGKEIFVSDIDYDRVSTYIWYTRKHEGREYATSYIGGKFTYLHNFILGVKGIDHKDHNGLNNQRENLRPCTVMQNNANMISSNMKKGRFKGVYFHNQAGRWYAQICPKGVKIHLGIFSTPEAAALAYDIAAKKYFGEFAFTNERMVM